MADNALELTNLTAAAPGANRALYGHVLVPGETILMEFKALRDVCVITDRKIIAVSVQGLTGKKKEVLVLPFSKMSAYATESSGAFDMDAELTVWSSGIGKVGFSFIRGTVDIREITRIMAERIG